MSHQNSVKVYKCKKGMILLSIFALVKLQNSTLVLRNSQSERVIRHKIPIYWLYLSASTEKLSLLDHIGIAILRLSIKRAEYLVKYFYMHFRLLHFVVLLQYYRII